MAWFALNSVFPLQSLADTQPLPPIPVEEEQDTQPDSHVDQIPPDEDYNEDEDEEEDTDEDSIDEEVRYQTKSTK